MATHVLLTNGQAMAVERTFFRGKSPTVFFFMSIEKIGVETKTERGYSIYAN